MEPLAIAADVPQQLVLTSGALALDALLMAAVARRDRLPPPTVALATHGRLPDVPIPVARSACGRVYLASEARPALTDHETRYKQRRFPVAEALRLTAMRSVNTGAGPQKSYRIPYTASFAADGRLAWWCVGDAPAVAALLEGWITHLGRYGSVGYGRVAAWRVDPVAAPWPGFPVLDREGRPLRPLPLDWPGLGEHLPGYARLEPPYWLREGDDVCALPVPP
jgi:CRISPR type IV-associated protein Csf3